MATTMKLIAKNVLGSSASSVTFSSIPGTYTDLVLAISARTDRNVVVSGAAVPGDALKLSFNGSTSNFTSRNIVSTGTQTPYQPLVGSFTGTNVIGQANADSNTASSFGSCEIYIPNYAGSANKSFSATGASETNGSIAFMVLDAGLWSQTAAITEIGLVPNGGTNFLTGSSFFLYGITKA